MKRIIILIILFLTLTSYNYQPQIREPFEEYNKIEEPYKAPNRAPIDWNSLDYDNPMWGWYYKQLWYLYHPNSTETPPWIKTVPLDDIYVLLYFSFIYHIYIHIFLEKENYSNTKPLQ